MVRQMSGFATFRRWPNEQGSVLNFGSILSSEEDSSFD